MWTWTWWMGHGGYGGHGHGGPMQCNITQPLPKKVPNVDFKRVPIFLTIPKFHPFIGMAH